MIVYIVDGEWVKVLFGEGIGFVLICYLMICFGYKFFGRIEINL